MDQAADTLYLALTEGPVSHSEEVVPGIVVDYDEPGHIVGIEVFSLTKRALGRATPAAVRDGLAHPLKRKARVVTKCPRPPAGRAPRPDSAN